MSYDLLAFKAKLPLRERPEFLAWYYKQVEWKEEHGYNNPDVTAPELHAWMIEMIKSFPAENGPFAKPDEEDEFRFADYNIGREIVYVTFPWDVAEEAYKLSKELAVKHRVGFFAASETEGELIFPDSA